MVQKSGPTKHWMIGRFCPWTLMIGRWSFPFGALPRLWCYVKFPGCSTCGVFLNLGFLLSTVSMLNQPDVSCRRSYSEKGPIGDAIPDSRGQKYTRWWFQHFFTFTPIWGRFPFGLIFSDGLKAPSSMFIFHQQISVFFSTRFHQVSFVLER